MLNVPVNNFSVMLGRNHRFLGINIFFGGGGGVDRPFSRTQHGDVMKTCLRVSEKFQHLPVCTAKEDGKSLKFRS